MTRHERLVYLTDWFLREGSGSARSLGLEPREITPTHLARSADGELFSLFRALVNVRPPHPVPAEVLRVQDEFLAAEIAEKGITDVSGLHGTRLAGFENRGPEIIVWQGDITTIRADAIVNAANSALLGCWAPNHSCIDNAIHTYAGVGLRAECARLMDEQGRDEPAGSAKITGAYNLPSRFVIHTVGPVVHGDLTSRDESLLAGCYESCLSLAGDRRLESIVFCCVSTGEFRFPNGRAAEIAVAAVRLHAASRPELSLRKIVFNVFKDIDRGLYERILGVPAL